MKTIIFLFSILASQFSFADAWDNLTLLEAQSVVAELEENPYIFNYCDCCDFSGEYAANVYFLKVTKTEIIECDWNSEFYSVKFESIAIAEMNYSKKGLNIKKLKKVDNPAMSEIIYMNYTWGYSSKDEKAHPFFNQIEYTTYGEAEPCKKPFLFPAPKAVLKVSDDSDYSVWYKERGL